MTNLKSSLIVRLLTATTLASSLLIDINTSILASDQGIEEVKNQQEPADLELLFINNQGDEVVEEVQPSFIVPPPASVIEEQPAPVVEEQPLVQNLGGAPVIEEQPAPVVEEQPLVQNLGGAPVIEEQPAPVVEEEPLLQNLGGAHVVEEQPVAQNLDQPDPVIEQPNVANVLNVEPQLNLIVPPAARGRQDNQNIKNFKDSLINAHPGKAFAQRANMMRDNKVINKAMVSRIKAVSSLTSLPDSAPAAGEADVRSAFWSKMFVNSSKQDAIINADNSAYLGYNDSGWGGSVGFDTKYDDNTLAGLAITLLTNKLIYSDNSNHHDKYSGMAVSGYAHVHFSDKLFSNAIVTYNRNNVEAKAVAGGNSTSASYIASNWNIETELEYLIEYKKFNIVPKVGLGVTYFNKVSYKESPDNKDLGLPIVRNVDASTNFEGILGIGVSKKWVGKHFIFTPEAHVGGGVSLGGGAGKITNNYNNIQLLSSDIPKPNNSFNVGTELNFDFEDIDLSLCYDVYLAKSFVAQQGSLKLKISL